MIAKRIIKQVKNRGSKRGVSSGNIYLPKGYIGKLVLISIIPDKEAKQYFKAERDCKSEREKRAEKLEKHLKKLNELRDNIYKYEKER